MAGGVANIIAHLQLNISNFTNGMDIASARLDAFSNNLRRSLQTPTGSATSRTYQDIVDVSDQFNVSMDRARRMLGITRSDYRNIIEQQRRWNAEVERSRFAFKDVARIIGGIIVAKIFYSGMQAIRSATDAVWEFSKAVEYAQITYANLFGDAELSNEFINVLQDFAAETVFSFSEAESAARRLLSYGIQYKNVMYMMQGVMAGATITGNEQNVERISRALGQIYTKGRLMGEEMRQLAEAGVPAYEILIEKLGLTQKQLQNLGRESIPASKAINALVDGINERFGSVVNAAAFTTTGLINKIQDNALLLANGVFEPVLIRIKSFLSTFANWLSDLRGVYNKSGIGGVFESVIPPHLQETVRVFIANLMNFGRTLGSVFKVIGVAIAHITVMFMNLFNMVMPAINLINNVLSTFMSTLFGTKIAVDVLAAALMVASGALIILLANMARLAIIKLFTNAINGLSKALAILSAMLTRHPILFFISMLAVGVAGLAMSNEKFRQSINKLTGNLTKLSGTDPSKVMMPESKQRAADLGKFNNKLEDTADAMDDLAGKTNKANKAGKAAKQLLSFDEVFKINDPDENKGTDAGDGIDSGDFDGILDGLSGLGSDIEIPSFDDITGKISSAFMEALSARMGSTITGAALGGIIGAAIGSMLGNPILGAKIGMAAGAIAGFFWKELKIKLTELGALQESSLAMVTAAGIGAGIGAALGGPAGAVVGAAIGVLVSGLSNMLWTKLAEAFGMSPEDANNASVGSAIGMGIGGVIGAIMGGPAGAIIGAGIGLLVGGIVGLFWETLQKRFTEKPEESTSSSIATGIGTVIGGIVGGAPGAIIGAVIGTVIGELSNWLWEKLAEVFKKGPDDTKKAAIGSGIGTAIGAIIGGIFGGPAGAGIGAVIGNFVGGLFGLFLEEMNTYLTNQWNDFVELSSELWRMVGEIFKGDEDDNWFEIGLNVIDGIIAGLVAGVANLLAGLYTLLVEPIIDGICRLFGIKSPAETTKPVGENLVYGIREGISNTIAEFLEGIREWSSDVIEGFSSWVEGVKESFIDWKDDTFNSISTWTEDTRTKFSNWKTNVETTVEVWKTNVANKFSTWKTNAETTIENWKTNVANKFSTWKTTVETTVENWKTNVANKFSTWKTAVATTVETWKTEVGTKFTDWKTAAETTFENWKTGTSTKFSDWRTGVEGTISDWKENAGKYISDWSTNAVKKIDDFILKKTGISDFCTTVGTKLKTWASEAYTNIKTNFDDSIKKLEDFLGLETSIGDFCKNTLINIKDWASDIWESIKDKFGKAINKIKEFVTNSGKAGNGGGNVFTVNTGTAANAGHATGGIFNKEHIARFAEGNKAEAVIPLENASAMQPFVDAISNGLMQSLLPAFASVSAGSGQSASSLPPMYVGTLIADERGLRELNKKMKLIEVQENARRGNS